MIGGIKMATKKSPTKKKNESFKLANKEVTNGAFILVLIICMVIACILGWVLGTYCANIF